MDNAEEKTGPNSVLEQRFRLLTIAGRRRAFKLEPAFWRALEQMARQREERLPTLVAQLVGDGAGNATARLRVAAVEWYAQQSQASRVQKQKGLWQRVIDLMSEPAFIIDQSKQILLFNGAMRALVVDSGAHSQIRLELSAEVGRILAVFRENEQKVLSIPGVLTTGQRPLQAKIRITLLEQVDGRALLLCALHTLPSESNR